MAARLEQLWNRSARGGAFVVAVLIHLLAAIVILRGSQAGTGVTRLASELSAGQLVEVNLAPELTPTPAPPPTSPQPVHSTAATRVAKTSPLESDTGHSDSSIADSAAASANDPSSSGSLTPEQSAPAMATSASDYARQLLEHIERSKRHPAFDAERMTGVVRVLFTLARNGSVLGAWVQTSSGSEVLDAEALATLLRGQPLPPIPPELPESMSFSFDIEFAPLAARLAG